MGSSDALRVLHLADLHLGASCAFMKRRAADWRRDLERAFERAMEFARDDENGINLVVIAGDLFDSHKPDPGLVELVREEFATLRDAGVHIVILPGTHDSVSPTNSVYRTEYLGDVLVLMEDGDYPVALEVGKHTVQIYGAIQTDDPQRVPLDRLSRVPAGGVHIGLLHGAVQAPPASSVSENGVVATLPALAETGLDYVAMGHHHNFKQYDAGGVLVVYPGTLVGRSFREVGERYLVTVTFTPEGPTVDKMRFNTRTIRDEIIDFDKTPCHDPEELRARIESIADKDTVLRLTVCGDAEFYVDTAALERRFSDMFFHFEVVDETCVFNTRWVEQFRRERTVRGLFIRRLADRIENAGTDEERKLLDMALKFGLRELTGKDAN